MYSRFALSGIAAPMCAVAVLATSALPAQAVSPEAETLVNLTVVPWAQIVFADPDPLLYLEVPPATSTVPSTGVDFTVIGNSIATMSALPDEFINVPGEGWLGRADLNSASIGYNIILNFPRTGVSGSPTGSATLPGWEEGPAVSSPVDLTVTGNEREGRLHLVASEVYTGDGGLALPGLYEGQITLTLTADW